MAYGTHNQVAHDWANRVGRYTDSAEHRMWHDGRTIYSYGNHFPIASHTTDAHGRPCVLFTTDRYSVTTEKHKSIVRRALGYGRLVPTFDVPYVAHAGSEGDNLQAMLKDVAELAAKAKRARSYGPHLTERALRRLEEARRYAAAFDLGVLPASVEDAAAELATREAADRDRRDAAMRQKRKDDWRRYREEAWPAIKAWLRGYYPGYVPHTTLRPLPRVAGDVVQTTWGASVPLEDARKAYGLAVACRRAKRGFKPEGMGRRVGDFALREIKPNGDIVVGCHDIPFWFMHYAACRAGIRA